MLIKYLPLLFISFFVTAIYRPQVEVINKHWANGSFTIEEPYLSILLLLFLIIIPVGLIRCIQLLKEELNDVEEELKYAEDELQEFKDIKNELYVEGVLDELAMKMGWYDDDEDEDDEY